MDSYFEGIRHEAWSKTDRGIRYLTYLNMSFWFATQLEQFVSFTLRIQYFESPRVWTLVHTSRFTLHALFTWCPKLRTHHSPHLLKEFKLRSTEYSVLSTTYVWSTEYGVQ